MNFIQNLSEIPEIFSQHFCNIHSENFPEICTNFSKNFFKNLLKISIKFYFRIAQILHNIVYPRFPENFLLFVYFPHIFIIISSDLSIFTINYSKFL